MHRARHVLGRPIRMTWEPTRVRIIPHVRVPGGRALWLEMPRPTRRVNHAHRENTRTERMARHAVTTRALPGRILVVPRMKRKPVLRPVSRASTRATAVWTASLGRTRQHQTRVYVQDPNARRASMVRLVNHRRLRPRVVRAKLGNTQTLVARQYASHTP